MLVSCVTPGLRPVQICAVEGYGGSGPSIETQTQGQWDRLVDPHDDELEHIGKIIEDRSAGGLRTIVNINNHYEGSAPRSIARLVAVLKRKGTMP